MTTNDERSTSSTTPTNELPHKNDNDQEEQNEEASDIGQDFGDRSLCNSSVRNGFWIRIGRQGTNA
jgi:hypothetical protein